MRYTITLLGRSKKPRIGDVWKPLQAHAEAHWFRSIATVLEPAPAKLVLDSDPSVTPLFKKERICSLYWYTVTLVYTVINSTSQI